jgi:hypothetical protein
MDSGTWVTEALPASVGMMQFMFTVGLDVNGYGRVDLVTGG